MNATLTLFDLAPTVAPSGESAEGGTGGQQRTPDAAPGAAPNVCSIDGCDKGLIAGGYCNKHYKRWYRKVVVWALPEVES